MVAAAEGHVHDSETLTQRLFILVLVKVKSETVQVYTMLCTEQLLSVVPWDTLFSMTSSIVTDGASRNTGEHHSLWKHLSNVRQASEVSDMPLLKIWCGVHRSQLAFKDMAVNVPEVSHITTDCKAVVNYYNRSAVRRRDIRNAAEECGADIMAFTSVKDILCTEYSYSMLSAVLTNYKFMIKHLESLTDAEGKRLVEKWLDQDTVHVASVLCEALYVYKCFQKLIQGDQITIFDLEVLCNYCMSEPSKLLECPLPGGYEAKIETCM